jgi:hypothetical protein
MVLTLQKTHNDNRLADNDKMSGMETRPVLKIKSLIGEPLACEGSSAPTQPRDTFQSPDAHPYCFNPSLRGC